MVGYNNNSIFIFHFKQLKHNYESNNNNIPRKLRDNRRMDTLCRVNRYSALNRTRGKGFTGNMYSVMITPKDVAKRKYLRENEKYDFMGKLTVKERRAFTLETKKEAKRYEEYGAKRNGMLLTWQEHEVEMLIDFQLEVNKETLLINNKKRVYKRLSVVAIFIAGLIIGLLTF